MKISYFTLAREELVSDTFALPYGRRVIAELEMATTVSAGSSPKEPDALQLVVESRANRDEPFTFLAQTSLLSRGGTVSVELPINQPPEVDSGAPPAVDSRDSKDESGTASLEQLPSESPPLDSRGAGNNPFSGLPPPPPTARVRVVHTGRLMPHFTVRLVGL